MQTLVRVAYLFWLRHYAHQDADGDVEPYLAKNIEPIAFGQLERARDALLRTTTYAAGKLKITRQSYAALEKSERQGKISLEKLQAAAKAIDCELVYAIRPLQRKVFSKVIFDALTPEALEHAWTLTRPKELKSNALYATVKNMFHSSEVRRRMGWSERVWLLPDIGFGKPKQPKIKVNH